MSQIYKVDKDQGLAEHQQRRRDDSRIRLSVARNIPEWDSEWGGDCPWREPDPEMDKLRRKAGLKELHPPPWYKRIARFYDENWEYIFEGVGPAIIFLAVFSIMALIIVNLGRATGWWGGVM